MALRKISRNLRIALAFIISTFSTGALPAVTAQAVNDSVGGGPEPKVFVCKYVGTPGVDERLQTGTNPISVNSSSTGGTAVGSYFADSQGRSFVLMVDNTAPGPEGDPDASACPLPRQNIPPTPSVTDPCGSGNAVWNVPANTDFVTWSLVGGVLSASTVAGYVFTDGTTVKNYGVAPETNVTPCPPEIVPLPATPAITDPCGTGNASWEVPADTATLDWELTSGVLSVTIIPANKTFSDGLTSHSFGVATETNVAACPPEQIVTPSVDQQVVCGPNNDVFSVADGAHYDVADNGDGTFTLTADTGYIFSTSGTDTETLVAPADQNTECPGDNEEKYAICHALGNDNKDGYVMIKSLSAAGIYNGHLDDGSGGTHGDHQNGQDIIPPFTYKGATYSQNWNDSGQATYRNDCKPPSQTVEDIDYTVICVPNGTKVTFTNSSATQSTVTVNGTEYVVPGNGTREVVLGYDLGTPFITKLTVTVGTTTATQTVNCTPAPSGGQVLGSSTAQSGGSVLGTAARAVLPAVLPSTGTSDSPFMIIVASIVAYGAAYFLQGRRLLARRGI